MPLAKDRELIQISVQAYKHLKAVVSATKSIGVPTSGTSLASQAILSLPIPQPESKKAKPARAPKASASV